MDEPVISTQSAVVFTVEPVKCAFYKIDDRFTGSQASHPRNLFAGFLFLTAPEQDKHHQHSRLCDVRIDRESAIKCRLGMLKVFGASESFENSVHMARAETVVRQGEFVIQFNRPVEMRNRRVTIVRRHGSKDKPGKAIATAQVLIVSFGINSLRLGQAGLFIRTQFNSQSIDNAFSNLVLYRDDVVSRRIYTIAPDDLAAFDLE